MGHEKLDKLSIQKSKLKAIFTSLLNTNASIMRFQLTLTKDEKAIKGLKKFIRDSEKAIEVINSITHYEILASLYNSFVAGKETYFATIERVVNKNDTKRWDRTEKGFKEFLELEQEARAKTQKDYEEKLKLQQEIIKAKEEGKKVEMVFENGKLKPRIVNEKSN